jgi:2-methylisocitrate lyase-like PEP mutase family enzyme
MTFKEMHRPGEPLVLPNAWDHASAAALAAAGFPAIGTTSLGVAAAAGKPDAAGNTLQETLALARLIAPLEAHITVDLEDGFSEDPDEVAELAGQLQALGVAGINLEDQLRDTLAAKVAAVKRRAPDLFVNARTDTYWLGREQDTTAARIETYVEAGADGVFVPGVRDEEAIAALTRLGAPLNVLATHPVARLAELGVARISTGSGLFRIALGAIVDAATAFRDGGPPPSGGPSYDEIQRFSSA